MPETADRHLVRSCTRVVGWWRSPLVRRGVLVAAVLVGCFIWAMVIIGLSFAMIERGVRQWWMVLLFGGLVLVVAVAGVYGVVASFGRVEDARAAAATRAAAAESTGTGARSPSPPTHTADVATRPAGTTVAGRTAAQPRQPVPGAVRLSLEPLSQRELEVLKQVAAGRSNNEIAKALYVAPGTVKAHLNHIFRKLQAASRLQAVAHARDAGLLDAHGAE
jgi:DNA-binding CsgD family transcriptional regulator